MQRLSDFKPLQLVSLPGIGALRCDGLVLVVGPNSAGKSQFLQDIYRRICGEPRRLVVASEITISKPNYEPFMACLEKEGLFARVVDDNEQVQLRPATTYLGTGQPIGQLQPGQAQQWHTAYSPDGPRQRGRNDFLNYFGRLLVTALFLERRLTALNQVNVIDFETQPPQADLHALFLDDSARELLFREVLDSFGKAVWPDTSRGSIVCLRVSDEGVVPTAEERHSPKKMSAYRTIETEGDGLKSYVATCVAILLGSRPVCILDEPEMCLHPPQSYNLGRFVGGHASSNDTATFVATHSSHFLRGALQTATGVQIVRLTRAGGQFTAHLVPQDVLTEALSRPTLRAESVLDGIFSQAVVVVEADSDRVVYQAVWETLTPEFRADIHFAPVGGTGGITDTCKLYRTLNIPIAIIADLDIIVDIDKLPRIVDLLVGDAETASELKTNARAIQQALCVLPPTVSPGDIQTELKGMCSDAMSWDEGSDVRLRKSLLRIAGKLNRMRGLKHGGVASFPKSIGEPLDDLLARLQRIGLFVVPVGELEEWLSGMSVGVSKAKKSSWASAAAQRVGGLGPREGDVWDFMRSVGKFLCRRMLPGEA